jgi:hypothetical protein
MLLESKRQSGRVRRRVTMNDEQQLLLRATPVVGIFLPTILTVKHGGSSIT